MGARVLKIKSKTNDTGKKPLSPLQKKLLDGPVMSEEEYIEFKKVNKWMGKWKV